MANLPLGPEQVPQNPPPGFVYLKIPSPQVQDFITNLSKAIGDVGNIYQFPINNVNYIARVEPVQPNATNPEWHKGLVVYIERPKHHLPQPKELMDKASNPKIIGTGAGATAGFYMGGPVGAVVGGAVGYVSSLIYKDIKGK